MLKSSKKAMHSSMSEIVRRTAEFVFSLIDHVNQTNNWKIFNLIYIDSHKFTLVNIENQYFISRNALYKCIENINSYITLIKFFLNNYNVFLIKDCLKNSELKCFDNTIIH